MGKVYMQTNTWTDERARVLYDSGKILLNMGHNTLSFSEEYVKDNMEELLKLSSYIEGMEFDMEMERRLGEEREEEDETSEDDQVFCDTCKCFVDVVDRCGKKVEERNRCCHCGQVIVDIY